MPWLDELTNFESNSTFIIAIIVGLLGLIYFIYKRYYQFNKYQSIEDNELHMMKLKAARLKQQEHYLEKLKQQAESGENKPQTETKTQNNDVTKINYDEPSDRDYFPLMNSGGSFSYKPIRKKPCSPCSGGGCG